MNKLFNNNWTYRILALLFTLLLFIYVNQAQTDASHKSTSSDNTILATQKATVSVPLQLNADTEKYFITGYPQKVSVTLEGPKALITTTTNTQNFRIIANLKKLAVGSHTVKLTQSGLNKDITYTIKPATIKVDIQKRDNRKFPIQVDYNKASLATGYEAGAAKLSQNTVEVTGARNEIERIDQIIASVPLSRNATASVSRQVLLQALDSQGNTVNAVITPSTVHVTLPIYRPSKKVSITLTQSGIPASGHGVTLESNTNSATIYGPQAKLDQIDSITASVDVAGISTTKTETITLKTGSSDVSIDPKTIKVSAKVYSTSSNSADAQSQAAANATSRASSSESEASSSSESSQASSSESDQSSESGTSSSNTTSSDDTE